MKTILSLTLIMFFLSMSFSANSSGSKEKSAQDTQDKNYAAGEVLVRFKPKTAKRIILALKQSLKVAEETYTESIDLYHWKGDFDTDTAIKKLQKSGYVLYAEPNYRVGIQKKIETH